MHALITRTDWYLKISTVFFRSIKKKVYFLIKLPAKLLSNKILLFKMSNGKFSPLPLVMRLPMALYFYKTKLLEMTFKILKKII